MCVTLSFNSSNFPNDLIHNPTSIFLETNQKQDIEKIKQFVFDKIEKMLFKFKGEKEKYLEEIKNNNYLKNKEVYALINNEKVLVKVLDINDDCSLKILYDNQIININSGEISFH